MSELTKYIKNLKKLAHRTYAAGYADYLRSGDHRDDPSTVRVYDHDAMRIRQNVRMCVSIDEQQTR